MDLVSCPSSPAGPAKLKFGPGLSDSKASAPSAMHMSSRENTHVIWISAVQHGSQQPRVAINKFNEIKNSVSQLPNPHFQYIIDTCGYCTGQEI